VREVERASERESVCENVFERDCVREGAQGAGVDHGHRFAHLPRARECEREKRECVRVCERECESV